MSKSIDAETKIRLRGNPTPLLDLLSQQGKGDGVTDDADALIEAALEGPITLYPGRTYRIGKNCTIDSINNLGGFLKADDGVTVEYGSCLNENIPCFKRDSTGLFKPLNNVFNMALYYGTSGNAKWDFCRAGMTTNIPKTTIFPVPRHDDPGASYLAQYNMSVWNLTDPLIFDDPENANNVFQYGIFYCARVGMAACIEYSPVNKTEDIYWRIGLRMDCGNNAIDGIRAHGGARMQVIGHCDISRPMRDGIRFKADVPAVADFSEPAFDFISCTGFGGNAVYIEGIHPRIALDMSIQEIFTNGARGVYATVTSVDGNGAITGLTIDANGPNGSAQSLAGHGWSGQTYKIMAKFGGTAGVANSGKGYGGTATPIVTLDGGGNPTTYVLTGVTLTGGGKYFVANEKVWLTSADTVVAIKGITRSCEIRKIYEYQDDGSNYCPVSDSYMKVMATAGGSSQNLQIGNIASQQGTRRALIVDDESGGAAAKHRINWYGGCSVVGAVFDNATVDATDNGALVHLHWIEQGYLKAFPKINGQDLIAKLGTFVTNFDFEGIDRERVLGNGDGVTFDGDLVYYTPSLADDNTVVIRHRSAWPTAGAVLKHVTFLSNNANCFFIGALRDAIAPVEAVKGSLTTVEQINTASVPGNAYGTDGNVTISFNTYNGYTYISNRSGAAMRLKLIFSK